MVDKSLRNDDLDFPGEDLDLPGDPVNQTTITKSSADAPDFGGEELDFGGEDIPQPEPAKRKPLGEKNDPFVKEGNPDASKPGRQVYDANNPPYDDDAFVKAKKLVNGVEYRQHSRTGVITGPDGKTSTDPLVLQAFGQDKPTKLASKTKAAEDALSPQPTYTGEATKGFFSGLAETVGMTMEGLASWRTSNPKAVKSLMADIKRFDQMPVEERENLRNGLFQRGINPFAAFQLRRALYQYHNGEVKRIEDSPEYQSAMEFMNAQNLPDDALYAKGQEIMKRAEKDFAAAPGWEDSLTRQVASGGGSTGMFLGGGLIAKGLSKLPVVGPALAEVAGKGMSAVGLATAAGGQMEDAREWMKKNKIDPESDDAERIMLDAAVRGAPSGLSENVPIDFLVERGFNRIPFLRAFKNSTMKAKIGRTVGKMLLQAATEGGQEGLQQMYQNIQALPYDEKRQYDEGAVKSALIGGLVGAGMQLPSSIVEETFAGDEAPNFAPPKRGRGTTIVNGVKWGYDNGQWIPLKNETAPGRSDSEAPPQKRQEPNLFPDQGQQPAAAPQNSTDVLWKMFQDAGITPADIKTMSKDQIKATIQDLISQGAWPEGTPLPEGFTSSAPPPGTAPMAPRPNKGTPDANMGQEAADQPSAEPIGDVQAQIADMQNPDSPRSGVFLSAEAWAHAGESIKGTKGGIKVENFDGQGGVLITRSKKIAKQAIADRDAGVPMQEILGKITGAGTGKPADGTAVVQQVTADGNVVRESLVTPETQEQTVKDFERDGHTVQVVTPEEAIKRREEQVAADNSQPDFEGQPITSAGTRENPVTIETPADLETVRGVVNPDPTEGQKEAGNYKHAHVKLHGFDIGIESPKGGTRSGKGPDGKPWSVTMPADYGKIKGWKGADGDEMDAYIGPDPKSPTVFIVHQKDLGSGKFDEHKVIFGTRSEEEAQQLYEAGFSDGKGRDRVMQIEEIPVEQLEGWLEANQGKRPTSDSAPSGRSEKGSEPTVEGQEGTVAASDGTVTPSTPDLNDTFDTLLDELAPEQKAEPRVYTIENPIGGDGPLTVRVLKTQGATGLSDGFGDIVDVTKMLEAGFSIEQAIAETYGDHPQGTKGDASKVKAVTSSREDEGEKPSKDSEKSQQQEEEQPSKPRDMGQNEGEVRTEDGEIMMVKLTPNGPWDFSDTYPQPILEQIEKMEREGRNPFQGDDTRLWMTEEVVYTIEDSLREMIDANLDAINAAQLRADLKSGKAKPTKGKTLEQAVADAEAAIAKGKQDVLDIAAEYENFLSPEAVKAMKRMAKEGAAKSQPRRPKAKKKAEVTDAQIIEMLKADKSPAQIMSHFEAQGYTKDEGSAIAKRAAALFKELQKAFVDTVDTVSLPNKKYPQGVKLAEIHVAPNGKGKMVASISWSLPGSGSAGLPDVKSETTFDTIAEARDAMARELLKTMKDKEVPEAKAIREWARQYLTKQEEKPTEQPEKPTTEKPKKTKKQAKQEAETQPAKPDLENLQDAGEKIGGARKDAWQVRGLRLADLESMNEAEKVKYTNKEAVWHRPDYADLIENKGMEPKAAYMLKLLYDAIPTAPLRQDNIEAFITAVDIVRAALEPLRTVEQFDKLSNTMLDAVIKEHPDGTRFFDDNYDLRNNALGKPKGKWNVKGYQFYLDSHDRYRAGREVEKGWPNAEPWTRHFYVRGSMSEGKPIFRVYNKQNIFLKSYPTKEEAVAAAKFAYETLQKDDTGGAMPERPHLDNVERKGPDYLKGRNITSEDFIKDFGFRGVEYGNWVAGDERQKIVNMAYEAFHDLAWALGVPPKAMSLNGTLAIAFGARGRGGKAAAHYEHSLTVINLTKLSGAGTLAHEWGHAFDHYLGELYSSKPYSGEPKSISGWRDVGKIPLPPHDMPANLARAARELMTGLYTRKETNEEMLARLRSEVQDALNSLGNWGAYLDSNMETVKKDPSAKRRLGGEIRKAKDQIGIWENVLERRKAALANPTPRMRKTTIDSRFYKEAKKLSGTGDYWIRGNEMLARSFEAYVFDKLAEKDYVSQYLVHGVEPDRFKFGFRGNAYPEGQERDDINALYDALMDTTQIGEKGGIEGKPGPLVKRDEPVNEPIAIPVPLDTSLDETDTPAPAEDVETDPAPTRTEDNVVEAFREFFRNPDNTFETIVQARKFAEEQGFTAKSGTLEAKELEEKIELALALLAREMNETMLEAGKGPREIYEALVRLYERQPRLATRTSTSMADQAYSTPVPLAYLAQNLAGITQDSLVYEPTAGNGALVFTAHPKNTITNEINDTRANHLRAQGFKVTQQDAAKSQQPQAIGNTTPRDVVIGNPPFGTMKDADGKTIMYDVDGWQTDQIDHAIVMNALKAMKPDGKAVFIVGSINDKFQGRERFHAYNQSQKRAFYFRLFQDYNVTDHFTVSGELYQKQGAGWPVDIIVIEGKGKSKRALPAVNLPEILTSWEQVKEKINGRVNGLRDQVREPTGVPPQGGTGLASDGGIDGEGSGGRGPAPDRGAPPVTDKPGQLGAEPDQRPGRNLGEQQSGESGPTGLEPQFVGDSGGPSEPPAAVNLENAFDNLLDDLLPEDAQPSSATAPTPSTPTSEPSSYTPPTATPSPSPTSSPSTPGEKLVSAAVNTAKGLDDVANGLFQLFHDPNKLGMGLNFDEEAYKKAKPLFQAAFEHFKDAAKDVVDAMRLLMKTLIDKYNFTREAMARMKPYVVRFIDETVAKKDLPKPGPTPKGEQETEGQKTYEPKSKMNPIGTLVPANMQAAMQDALGAIERQYGNIDEWVGRELGYTPEELKEALSAEQVDAVAMALDQVKQGKAFIIGDQTGIGKGRVVASMLRYALRNGLTPVFVTHKPNLYGDIIRDLKDIGIEKMLGREPRVFMTNQGEEVPLDAEAVAWFEAKEQAKLDGEKAPPREGKFLKTATGAGYKKDLAKVMQDGGAGIDKSFDIIATTYNQMQTVKGGETDRRNLLRLIAPNSFLVMDESHNAGGTGGEDRGPKNKKDGTPIAPDASKFFREIVGKAQSIMFSSATYAKRPEVMDLYARTDMGLAVAEAKSIGPLIEAGGVPMQQVVASMLTEAGQYIRRERSFAGITYEVRPVEVDTDAYKGFSQTMRAVYDFDREMKGSDWWPSAVEDALAAAGVEISGKDNAVGETSVHSATFSSIMHNMVNQMLLGIKVDSVADMAIAEIKAGRKPVITVSGTMGAFIEQVANDLQLKPGEDFSKSFRDVAKRYLKRTMRLTVKDPDGNKMHIQIEPEVLPADLRATYDAALKIIEGMSDDNIPLSPIDWLRFKLEKAGYNVGEITGRKHIMRYTGKNLATYGQRTDGEISIAGRGSTLARFNQEDGTKREIHALILNRAGSTGLSAHAYYKFKNKKPRVMLIAQAEGNIDDHMQLLGRINRTGQVVLPSYIQAYADIPAEARPAAVLAKKMASLNANTTASRKGALSSDEVDFINQYGDEVVMGLLTANPELQFATGLEVSDTTEKAGIALKFTGKLTLLDPQAQADVLNAITENYKALLAEKDALGENALEAKTLDLQAVTLDALEMRPASGTSPFQQAVMLETLEVKSEGKAMTLEEIRDIVARESGMTPKEGVSVLEQLQDMEARAKDQPKRDALTTVYKESSKHIDDITKTMRDPEKKKAKQNELYADLRRWADIVFLGLPGRRVVVETKQFGRLIGVAMNIERRNTGGKGGGNPTALGAWSVTVALPDNSVQLKIPFNSIALDEDPEPQTPAEKTKAESRKIGLYPPQWDQKWDRVAQVFEEARRAGKDKRFMFTGNILGGYELARGGQIVNYTNDKGEVRPGVLMPKAFNKEGFLDSRPVEFSNARQVAAYLRADDGLTVTSSDGLVNIRWSQRDGFVFEVNPGRNTGGKYFLNSNIRTLTNDSFVKRGAFMTYSEFSDVNFGKIVKGLIDIGARFQSKNHQDLAVKAVEDNPDNSLFQKPILAQKAEMPRRKDNEAFAQKLTPEKQAKVAKALQDLAVAILGHRIKVELVSELGPNWGQYEPERKTIFLSAASENFVETLGHEALHGLRDLGVFTKAEWQILKDAAAKFTYEGVNMTDLVYRYYDRDYRKTFDLTEEQHQEMLQEEAVAFMVGAHLAGTGGNKAEGRVAQIIEKFGKFLEAVRNLLKGNGFKTAEGVMKDIMAGAMKNRIGQTPGRGYYMKARQQPEGQVAQKAPETDAFKRWFGDSKVVDESGKPLVVYHGTMSGDIDVFNTGSHFGTKKAANDRLDDVQKLDPLARPFGMPDAGEEQSNIMPVYLSIKNPFVMHDLGQWGSEEFARAMKEAAKEPAKRKNGEGLTQYRFAKADIDAVASGEEDAINILSALGFDGIKYTNQQEDKGSVSWIPFEETQIKSAIGNAGTYNPSNPSILAQRIMPKSQPNRAVTFQEPEDSASAIWASNQPLFTRLSGALEAAFLPLRREMQDNMQDWQRIEKAIETQTGNPLNPALRVYQAETLYAGRTGERLEDLRMDTLEPLAADMQRLGVKMDELDDFLTARHAQERNAYIATINPNMPDGGSGMMNADAQGILARFQNQGKLQALQQVAQRIDDLLADARRNLLNGGVIDQNTFTQWTQQYQHYVPLRGDPNENEAFGNSILGAGRKYDTRNKVAHAAMGRRSRSESPTAWAIAQAQQAIVLAEKARVGRAALRLARRFPNKNVWEVDQAVMKRTISKATGLVVSYVDHRAKMQADNVLAVREGGNLYYLTLHHPGMAQAMKNLEGTATPSILRIFQTLQRYYALMRTGLDPQFFIPNFLRDIQTAGVHIAADQGAKILKETIRDIPKAMRGVWRGERGNLNSQWAQIYRDFGQAGGKVGIFGLESIEDIKGKIERDIALMQGGAIATPYKWGREGVKFLMDLNSAVENAVRLSLYAAMRRNGYSRDDAALAAKEVTVNFNRKGNGSKWINAAYVFFNASVQGTARVAIGLAKSKLVRRTALGLFVAGILQDIMNAWMSGDSDDDGEDDYDQIPEWIRERNYVVMLPWASDKGGRVQIPMPWVYNVFHYAGTNVGRALRGKVGSTEAAANVFGALISAMNPIQSNSLAQTVTPSLLDPAIELYANKDWKGDPIMPEQSKFEAPKPDSQLYWESVNPIFKEASRLMNEMSGGDEVRPGAIDISPETLEYIGEFLGGGVASTYNQILSTAGKAWRGEEIDPERVPFVRKLYGVHSTTQSRNEYYTMREAVKLTEEQLKQAVEEGDANTIEAVREKYGADIKAVSLFKDTDKVLTELRKARRATTDGEKRQMIQAKMDEVMAKARKAYRKLQEGSGQ